MRLHQAGTEGSASKDHEALEAKRVKETVRLPPDRQQVQRFDDLLREQLHAKPLAEREKAAAVASGVQPDAVDRFAEDLRQNRGKTKGLFDGVPMDAPPALLAMLNAVAPVQAQVQLAAAQSHSGSQRASDVVELLRKHVRQLALSPSHVDINASQAWLKLSDDLLPGTELLIQRDGSRWSVQARTGSRESLAAIDQCQAQLQQRFAEADLGEVSLEVRFESGV
jgi:hypothetical protein